MVLHTQESGSAPSPTIVLLHGGGLGGWMWQPQVERLDEFHCLVPDLPAHGKSTTSGPFTIAGAAESVAELIRARAHGSRAHLVGMSLGAQVALKLLDAHPDLIDRIVLTGCSVRPRSAPAWVERLLRIYMPWRNRGFLVRANMRALRIPKQYRAEFEQDTRAASAEFLATVLRESLGFAMPASLSRRHVPVLILAGGREPKIVRQSAVDLEATLPNARSFVIAGKHHAWSFEAPQLFSDAVRAWLLDRPLPPELLGKSGKA